MLKRKLWSKVEDEALQRLILPQAANPQWEAVAAQMVALDFAKTSKQCKDRWVNNLSPALNKTKWSCAESKELLSQYLCSGNKWKVISGIFAGRTDNSVKNQFFSVIRKSLRTMNKYLGINCNTNVINSIRPKVLAELLASEPENRGRSALVQRFSFTPFAVLTRDADEAERAAVAECVEYVVAQNASYITQKVKPRKIAKLNKSMTTNRTNSVANTVVNVEIVSASSMVLEELHAEQTQNTENRSCEATEETPVAHTETVDRVTQQVQSLLDCHATLRSAQTQDNAQLRQLAIDFFGQMCSVSASIKAELELAGDGAQGTLLATYVGAATKLVDFFKGDASAIQTVEAGSHARLDESFEHDILGSIHNLQAEHALRSEATPRKPTAIQALHENQASVCFYDAQYIEPVDAYRTVQTGLFCEQLEEMFEDFSAHDSFL